jgi:hypothetical protein
MAALTVMAAAPAGMKFCHSKTDSTLLCLKPAAMKTWTKELHLLEPV